MALTLGVISETRAFEARVPMTPDTAKKFLAAGMSVMMQAGAGQAAGFTDAAYGDVGVHIVLRDQVISQADVMMAVTIPDGATLQAMKEGAVVIGLMPPLGERAGVIRAAADRGLTLLGLDYVPRTSRAQTMDVLSSQANLAGYRAVLEAAAYYGRAFPMMMTAAGTIAPAKVFVMGAGVAGLQAIATARRLGAVVTATDVRLAAKEQVQSLGAKFLMVEDDETRVSETSGGYAKEMSDAYKAKQAALVDGHLQTQNIVITTAQIPGRPAPRLLNRAMVERLPVGSVVVDMAAGSGGNVEGTVPDQVVTIGGATLVGYTNLPARIPFDASHLLARNIHALCQILCGDGTIKLDDDIIKAMVVTHQHQIIKEG